MNKKTWAGILLGCVLAITAAGQNLFTDAGFESFRKVQKNCYWWQVVKADTATAVSVSDGKHAGARSLEVTLLKDTARIYYLGKPTRTEPGMRWKISVHAKGNGTLQIIVPQFGIYPDLEYEKKLQEAKSPVFKLTNEWKKYEFVYTGTPTTLFKFNVQFELTGKGSKVTLDTASLTGDSDKTVFFRAHPKNCVARPGENIVHEILSKGVTGKSCVDYSALPGGSTTPVEIPADGKIRFKAPEKPGIYSLAIFNKKHGIGSKFIVQVLTNEQYDKLEKLSQNIKNPGRVLILADSLTDYLRGRNWADILEFFCWKKYGRDTMIFNYAIGGDKAPRTLDRLRGKKGTYALDRYEGIADCKPDTIYIFLGQNDSLLLNRDLGAKSPTQVPPEEFVRDYSAIIKLARKMYGEKTRFILITPVAMDYKKTWKLRFGNSKIVYGEPTIMENYRQLVYRIAKENNCEVLDVFAPLKAKKDLASYSLPDGVHINLKGNYLVAETALQHLAK
ncbi:MAG: carbohydrate binding domain-containing protein [Lentisphaeria bacterium]|nr:carbohydrate binding domain-containing protein [Lentisphaeria bacterium]